VPIGLQDMYATFAEIVGAELPDLRAGEKGAEDSVSVLAAFRGEAMPERSPLFFNDHKEAKGDAAVVAMRLDSPEVGGQRYEGQWKLFFDARLLRAGEAHPIELYNLAEDQWETTNLVTNPELKPLVEFLTAEALMHRNAGGHRVVAFAPEERVEFRWDSTGGAGSELVEAFEGGPASGVTVDAGGGSVTMTVSGVRGEKVLKGATFNLNPRGLGVSGGEFDQVEDGEALVIGFDRDVLVESAAIVAGNGVCGGFYQVGDAAPLAIYCVDGDNDAKEQEGILSDIGVLKAGEVLRFDSSPHFGVEAPGQWRLGALTVRVLDAAK
jgi:hypothetical protein